MDFIRRKIKIPKSLGETLKNARKKKEFSLEQAEEETKVRAKYLEALEESRYELLPASVYAAGFLAKYAEFLGLNKEKMVEQFSHERGKVYNHAKIMVERRIREPFFSITPKFILVSAIIIVLASLIGYIAYSVHQFTSPPNLAISSPSADQVIKEDNVHIIGKTDQGVTLMINGENISTDDKGNFNQIVKLHGGLNSFEVRSINGLKKENVKLIKVLAEIPGVQMPVTVDQPVEEIILEKTSDKTNPDTTIKTPITKQPESTKTTTSKIKP